MILIIFSMYLNNKYVKQFLQDNRKFLLIVLKIKEFNWSWTIIESIIEWILMYICNDKFTFDWMYLFYSFLPFFQKL